MSGEGNQPTDSAREIYDRVMEASKANEAEFARKDCQKCHNAPAWRFVQFKSVDGPLSVTHKLCDECTEAMLVNVTAEFTSCLNEEQKAKFEKFMIAHKAIVSALSFC